MSIATIFAALVGAFAPAPVDGSSTPAGEAATPVAEPTIALVAVDTPDAAERAEAISAHLHGSVAVVVSGPITCSCPGGPAAGRGGRPAAR